jgi:hypothetical protein
MKLKSTYLLLPTLSWLALSASAYAEPSKSIDRPGSESGAASGASTGLTSPPLALAMRFDCMHDFNASSGAAQNCISISGLRLTLSEQAAPNLRASLRLDPFSTPRPSRAESPLRTQLPSTSDTALGIVDQFKVVWTARPSLDLAIQSFDGAALPQTVSGLALGNQFMDAGWKQTALTLDYTLNVPMPLNVMLVAGNGEGQTLRAVTPQQYFGLQARMTIERYISLMLGVSANGNDAGSEESIYARKRVQADCSLTVNNGSSPHGHSTRRMAVGVVADGGIVGLDGFKVGLAWQGNTTKDLAINMSGDPTVSQLEQSRCQLDPDLVFIQQSGVLGSWRRTIVDASLKYRFSSGFFLAADYTTRRLSTNGSGTFKVCESDVDNQCLGQATGGQNQLNQAAWTAGVGATLAPDLQLTLEYYTASYDENYAHFYYAGANGRADKDFSLFNARLAYRWQ